MIKPCSSFPGYSATDDCRVISHRRRGKGKQRGSISLIDSDFCFELKQSSSPKGYLNVSISFGSDRLECINL